MKGFYRRGELLFECGIEVSADGEGRVDVPRGSILSGEVGDSDVGGRGVGGRA